MWLRLTWWGFAAASAIYLFSVRSVWPFAASGLVKAWDFAGFWGAARRVLDGNAVQVYEYMAQRNYIAGLIHQFPGPDVPFVYPPTALLLIWPLGLISYGMAMLAFVVLGACLWFTCLKGVMQDHSLALPMTFAFGGATHSVFLGQNGFYTAALLIGGLLLLPTRPRLAGVLFGVLTIKPHLGIALAIALLIWRQWRAAGTAALTAAVMVACATFVFGPTIWSAYLAGGTDTIQIVARNPILIEHMMQSVFALLHEDLGAQAAMAAHAAQAVVAVVIMALVARESDCAFTRSASVVAATLLVTPYLFIYDSTMLIGAAAFLLASSTSRGEQVLTCAAAALPGVWFVLNFSYVPLAAWIMLLLCVLRVAKVRRGVQTMQDA